ncbi:DHA2 family efflux MFS transporter permease subunit [Cohnella sp. CFH 77786]|uniref:DHA2 family efflux MFS transporter permease subunit n=1 Tax=Cohnella sp. CFH 77786 TaxID=2662265 RepID=UPI001C60C9CC|nr:DHA2 family efflux MFS transporter permease subunit [Cohnella sp. CFH 77786]MBW5446733.1 DHA2 family efflux MFS transporter permease subunit [Cohnella sp. CFH 77786]
MAKESSKGLIILSMMLGLLMSSLDNTIVSASINKVVDDIGGFDKNAWIFTAYMLAATSTMLIFGKLSDMFGRKKFYLIGIGLFLTGSALCGTATDIYQLIFYRVIQGIGSGSIFPISFSIIYTLFNDPKDAAKMSGVFGAVFGLSSVAGPQLGTWISDHLGWQWCFFVNLPIGIASFLVLLFALKESKADDKPKIDFLGAFLIIVSTVAVMLALELGGKDYAWDSWQIIGLFVLSVIGGTIFYFVEKRAHEPMLPLNIFKSRMVSGTSLIVFCQGAIMFSAITYMPYFATYVLGKSSSNALLTPMMASVIGGAILLGFLQAFFKFRTIMFFNMALGIVVSLLLMNLSYEAPYWQAIGIVVLLGLGVVGPLMSVAQNSIAASVDKKYIGVSSSIVGFWRSIGGVMGASVTAVIVNRDMASSAKQAISQFQIPADQIATAGNPGYVFRFVSQFLPKQADLVTFYSHELSHAINHGFVVSLCFMGAGLIASLFVGPARMQMKRKSPEAGAQHI